MYPWERPQGVRVEGFDKGEPLDPLSLSLARLSWDFRATGKREPADPQLLEDLIAICAAPRRTQVSKICAFVRRHGPLTGPKWLDGGHAVKHYITMSEVARAFTLLCRSNAKEEEDLRGLLTEAMGVRLLARPNEIGYWWSTRNSRHGDLDVTFALMREPKARLETTALQAILLNYWARTGSVVPTIDLAVPSTPSLRWPGMAWAGIAVGLQNYFLHSYWTVFCTFCGRLIKLDAHPKYRAKAHCCGRKECHNRRARESNRASRAKKRAGE